MRYHSTTWLLIGIFIFSLTAWLSEGYHHPDEHFQILEFAYVKLAPSPPLPHSLAWEYDAQIRPGLQPFVAWCFMKLFLFIGITDPFFQSFLFRWMMAMLSLFVYNRFITHFVENQKVAVIITAVFLWFMPYLSVRFSSEQTSGLTFLMGIYAIMHEPGWKNWGIAGLFFCLSFYLRYQMGFAIFGAMAWLVWHYDLGKILKACKGFIPGVILGILLGTITDFWLYQKWVFPYINYFTVNVLENKAAQWGTTPFWYYPFDAIKTGVPPLSLFFLGLAVWGAWKHRRHILVWSIVPFILAHSLIGHKELRFMFPIVFPLLIFALWGLFEVNYFKKYRMLRALAKVSIFINFVLLFGRSLTAAQEGIPNLRFLYHYAEKGPCTVYALDKSPYSLVGPEANYLKHPNINLLIVKDVSEIKVQGNTLFLSTTLNFPAGTNGFSKHRIFTYIPEWILQFNINNWQERSRIWSIWEVN